MQKIKSLRVLLLIICSCSLGFVHAQTSNAKKQVMKNWETSQARANTLTADIVKAQLIKDWERAKAYTNEYLNTMPADKYSFRPVDSIRSFANQMLHLSEANCFISSMATGLPMPPEFTHGLADRASAQSKDSVVYFVNKSYDYATNAVKSFNNAKAGEIVKLPFGDFSATRFALLLKAFEHQTHHRGQTTIYIRLQGIKPPQEKLF